jgi:hypothetical protein
MCVQNDNLASAWRLRTCGPSTQTITAALSLRTHTARSVRPDLEAPRHATSTQPLRAVGLRKHLLFGATTTPLLVSGLPPLCTERTG